MICRRCAQAADARAPRSAHCDAKGGPGAACDCAHRVERYSAPDGESCQVVEVDGTAVRLAGGGPITDLGRWYLAEVIAAAKRRYAADHPNQPKERDEPTDPDCDCQPPRTGGHDAHCLSLCANPHADHTNGCPH